MRLRELFLIETEYVDDLENEIINLLTSVNAEGISKINTNSLLKDLIAQGYDVNEQTLLGLLDDLEIVQTASADEIIITTSDISPYVGNNSEEMGADRVDKLATANATKSLKM